MWLTEDDRDDVLGILCNYNLVILHNIKFFFLIMKYRKIIEFYKF